MNERQREGLALVRPARPERWHVYGGRPGLHGVADQDGRTVAAVHHPDEARVAALIAAAPQLRDAALQLVAWDDAWTDSTTSAERLYDAVQALRAALAAATGGTR